MGGDDKEKKLVSERRDILTKEIEVFTERQRDIETTYIDGDMREYLEELRTKKNGPTAGSLHSNDQEENEVDDRSDIMSMIASINIEISDLETDLVKAQINGEECNRIEMSLSSLKSRRYDLIEKIKSEKPEVVETSNDEIDEIRTDITSLRTQIGSLRIDVMDLKEMIMRVIDHLGMNEDD
jgi:chromosome segregation ATPase